MLLHYKVNYHNVDYDGGKNGEPPTLEDEGLLGTDTYDEAVKQLYDAYGNDEVFTFSFTPLTDWMTKDELLEEFD